ncbi:MULTISPECIES: MFS transporter [Acinetobacter]|uniref:MFS transporter n=1 Tax=Acinetobacter TaxID=469 RepID=UPI0015D469EC|nr:MULTISPECIES: MFS transporter [Acinetobacter]MDM1273718.1 MFS transporter [Acinetobacter indicus]QOW52969.1 MFS transporter [Acinetobacter indicus]
MTQKASVMVAEQVQAQPEKIWKTAFILCFFILLADGIDLAFLAYSLTSIKAEFNLTTVQAGALGSWSLVGGVIGGLIGGWACDRFGRVKVIVFYMILASSLSCTLGFVDSYYQFLIVRSIAAIGLGSLYIACNTLMSEYVPTKYRTTVLAALMTGFTLGSLCATLLAGWIIPEYGWRMLYWITIFPIFLAFLMYFLVPEPESWLRSREHKRQEALHSKVKIKKQNPYLVILKDKKHRWMFMLWILSAGALQFGYAGLSNWLPAYLESDLGISFKEMTGYMVGTFLIMIFAKVVAGILADRFGRRALFAFGTMGTALFLPVIIYFNTPTNILYLMLMFGFLYGMPFAINATYMTESFPTSIRGTAVGGAFNIGRIGAVFAPLTIGYFAQGGSIGTGLLIMAAAYFICGLIPALFIKDRLYDPQKAN